MSTKSTTPHEKKEVPPERARLDPVCGMTVDSATARSSGVLGVTHFFCCARCQQKLEADPRAYLDERGVAKRAAGSAARGGAAHGGGAGVGPAGAAHDDAVHRGGAYAGQAAVASASGTTKGARVYTCPMDPEVKQDHPGPCPKCGMALEPMTIGRAQSKTEYVCPMHPEIVRDAPGACPKCGMALEPRVVELEEDNPELRDMSRRFWVSLVFTVPLFFISMGEMVPGDPIGRLLPHGTRSFVELALAGPVVIWCGLPFFERAWASVKFRSPNMFTLVALGSGAAFAYSAVATLFPGIFPQAARGHRGEVAVYYEAAAVIVSLVLLGQVLELRARSRTSGALRALLGLAPKSARKVTASGEEDVDVDTLVVGDRVRVRPGERIPVDGHVIEGSSFADESMITGEAIAVPKNAGDAITGGTINGKGPMLVEVDRTGEGTLLAQIVRMVGEAQRSRAPIQKLVDRVSGVFVPAVMAVSLVAFVVWFLAGPEPRLAHAVVNAVAVLIIACPCALGLATPMSIMVGTGRGATLGILVKNAEVLDRFEKIDTLILDKTGTITEGRPEVVDVVTYGEWARGHVLQRAALLERQSEHPLGAAIVRAVRGVRAARADLDGLAARAERDVRDEQAARDVRADSPLEAHGGDDTGSAMRVSGVEVVDGEGIRGTIDGREVLVGNERFLARRVVSIGDEVLAEAMRLRTDGRIVVYVAIGGGVAGLLGIADPVKASARETISDLTRAGLRILIVTGDNEATARAVAKSVGVGEVRASVLPNDKAAVVRELQSEGRRVAMAGDGINDAPALAQADVGIAMGAGTDVAIESAGITLVKGDLRGIVRARALSLATMKNIRQNLVLSFVYNTLGVPIAAGVLYPALGLLLSPMVAAAAMSLSSLSVIANALRLRALRL